MDFRRMIMLYSDSYKQCHPLMYPDNQETLVSYLTPRKAMNEHFPKMVVWGIHPFIEDIKQAFNEFFSLPLSRVMGEYDHYIGAHLGIGNVARDRIIELHELGYLPLEIRALPEGTVVNMGIPMVEMRNTHPRFAWVVQWVECLLQTEVWPMCAYATVGWEYHKVAKKYYEMTAPGADPFMAMADFGFRGMSCLEDATRCSASWLLSFNKTSTIPALPYLDDYYDAQCAENKIGLGAVSTEHSVMAANFAIDGDEITFVKRMLTEIYPNTSFSMVSDTYDYWNMVNSIIPACKAEILAHNGKLLVRPDSGDMVSITIGTIQKFWDTFGGTINEAGYKVLDPHIGMIYGDGCTLNKVTEIYETLAQLGFAATNVVFGVGAFCFHALFDPSNKFTVLTRDTWGMAMKATHGVFGGQSVPIFKDPKTDEGGLKKSQKGCCMVSLQTDGSFICTDGYDEWVPDQYTCLQPIFCNGKLINVPTFQEARARLYPEVA
ncbi:MAG: nicotinate phosphoribosyltransferase [Bacteroides sp.]|nr:nicotinate phosphoribosyltransferase [Bacteroides sp.]